MALFQGNVFSRTLGFETQVYVSLPQDGRRYQKEGPDRTLILLHGVSDNASGWIRHGLADTLAAKYNIAVLIPEGMKGLWLDMAFGPRYTAYLTGELPELASKMFHLPVDREHLMIAGLSMGGFGALHAALTAPQTFGAVGSFSGVTDMKNFVASAETLQTTSDCGADFAQDILAAVGPQGTLRPADDLYVLADQLAQAALQPQIYLAVGEQDILTHSQNEAFFKHLQAAGLQAVYETWPGVHDWTFWNVALDRFLENIMGQPEADNVFGGIPRYEMKQ